MPARDVQISCWQEPCLRISWHRYIQQAPAWHSCRRLRATTPILSNPRNACHGSQQGNSAKLQSKPGAVDMTSGSIPCTFQWTSLHDVCLGNCGGTCTRQGRAGMQPFAWQAEAAVRSAGPHCPGAGAKLSSCQAAGLQNSATAGVMQPAGSGEQGAEQSWTGAGRQARPADDA